MKIPHTKKSFRIVMGFLLFYMVIKILTSDSYLFRVMDITRIKDSFKQPTSAYPSLLIVPQTETKTPVLSSTPRDHIQKKMSVHSTPQQGVRPDSCVGCFVHDFQYLIQNTNICNTSSNGTIDLMIVILTVHSNVKQRANIRASWLAISNNNTGNVRYAFLLGRIEDKTLMEAVSVESSVYGDILMEDFMDAYSNLTYKTIMGMKWASLYCPEARFFMKTDDDMWVNVPELLKVLNKHEIDLQKNLGGACSKIRHPIRNHRSKWYASFESYPHNSYPGLCSGTGYVTSMNVIRKIYEVSPNIPFFHLEDVYVSLCIRKLGMTLMPIPGFFRRITPQKPCEMRSPRILTSHEVPTDYLMTFMKAKC